MEFESVMMAKAALDYLTICIEVLTQVRARDREKRREEERRESNDEKTIASAVFFLCSSSTFSTSFRPSASFFSPFISLSLSLSLKKKKKKTAPPPPLRAPHRRDRRPHRGADLHRDRSHEVRREKEGKKEKERNDGLFSVSLFCFILCSPRFLSLSTNSKTTLSGIGREIAAALSRRGAHGELLSA